MDARERFKTEVLEPGLKNGTYYRLLPRHEIYLSAFHGEAKRFLGLFRLTWRRIPVQARRCILKYWKTKGPDYREIVQLFKERYEDEPLAHSHMGGTEVRFFASVIDAMSDEEACVLIAHELAHVYQHATDRTVFKMKFRSEAQRRVAIEADVDFIILKRQWGFDWLIIDDWCRRQGKGRRKKS
jgi:hypothetical protein